MIAREHILLVEDNPTDALFIERRIRDRRLPYEMDIVASSREAARHLDSNTYQVAMLNYRMSDGTAFDLFPRLKDTPVILLTDMGGEEVAGLALRRGAYDYLIKDPEGNYLSLLPGTIHNVIVRKQAEDALKKSEERYQDLFDNAPDMYFLIGADGCILSVNRQIGQLGYEVEEMIGQSIYRLIHDDDEKIVKREIEKALLSPHTVRYTEFQMVRAGGQVLHIAESHSAQSHHDERPTVIRMICRDITERIEAQQRELDLQERLMRDERMKSLGVLAGGVAHDLNNILGPMIAYPDLLMQSFPEDSREYHDLVEIKHCAGRAIEVVRDLLTLARSGKAQLKRLDLNDVVQDYLRSPSFTDLVARYPMVSFSTHLEPNLNVISGASSQLMKAFMNLVINAFEATSMGGQLMIATLNVTLTKAMMGYEEIPPGDYVRLRVVDTGPGIPPEVLGKMFEPFFSSKDLGRSGSGLGLAVVYGVVRDHAGYIDVTSQPGQGAGFSMYIPRAHGDVEKDEPEELDIRGAERLLVVDDLPDQRSVAARLLASLGYHVDVAENGHAALERFAELSQDATGSKTSPFALVLMDMVLEDDFDGLDTYQAIKIRFPDQRCIIVSGVSSSARVWRMQEMGAGEYVRKPYTLDVIGRAVREELDRVGPLTRLKRFGSH